MIVLVLVCLSVNPGERFASDYSREVQQLKQNFSVARGTATITTLKSKPTETPKVIKFATAFGRRKFEFDKQVTDTKGKKTINSYGYAELDGRNIEVQRSGRDAPYIIRGMGDNNSLRQDYFDAGFGKYLKAAWSFRGNDIEEILKKGFLVVTGADDVNIGTRKLVEVTFKFVATTEQAEHLRIAFDPAQHWAIAKAAMWREDEAKPLEREDIDYSITASGQSFLKTIHTWEIDGKEKQCEFDAVDFVPVPASEFSLEYYNLKSPPLPVKKSNLALVIGAASLALVLAVSALLVRRRLTN